MNHHYTKIIVLNHLKSNSHDSIDDDVDLINNGENEKKYPPLQLQTHLSSQDIIASYMSSANSNSSSFSPIQSISSSNPSPVEELQSICHDGRAYLKPLDSISPSSTPSSLSTPKKHPRLQGHLNSLQHNQQQEGEMQSAPRYIYQKASTQQQATTTTTMDNRNSKKYLPKIQKFPRKKEFILTVSLYSEPQINSSSSGDGMLTILSYNGQK